MLGLAALLGLIVSFIILAHLSLWMLVAGIVGAAIIGGVVAGRRGRSSAGWFLLVLLFPFTLAILLWLPSHKIQIVYATMPDGTVKPTAISQREIAATIQAKRNADRDASAWVQMSAGGRLMIMLAIVVGFFVVGGFLFGGGTPQSPSAMTIRGTNAQSDPRFEHIWQAEKQRREAVEAAKAK